MGKRQDVREKEARALELRAQGRNLDDIAAELGYADRSGASRAISRALDRSVKTNAEHYLALVNAQLDALDDQAAAAHRAFGTNADANLKAIDVRRKIVETRNKVMAPRGVQETAGGTGHGNDFGAPRGFMLGIHGDGFEEYLPWDLMVINASPGQGALPADKAGVVYVTPAIVPDHVVRQLIAEGGLHVGGIFFSIPLDEIPDELIEALSEVADRPDGPLSLMELEA